MKFSSLLLLATSASASSVLGGPKPQGEKGWGNFKNLVAFGDSYTDEGRLNYFGSHNGAAPPVGTIMPIGEQTASGGRSWARYVAQYSKLSLYNYAVSGAVCSNDLTPRTFSTINALFPSVSEYEVPAFKADLPKLKISLKNTVVSLWIGTNDLGGDALFDHSQLHGVTIVDFSSCVFEVLKKLHALGARHFVLQNVAPIYLAPLYTDLAHGGSTGPNRFWLGRGDNATESMVRMKDNVLAVNEIWKYKSAATVKEQLPGAKLAYFDSHKLMSDIYNSPANYLNGSLPLDVTGYNDHCDENWSNCFKNRIEDRDSFFWYDELHPSEQVGRVIAQEFSKTLQGKSKYATFW